MPTVPIRTDPLAKYQCLISDNTSPNTDEALQARVKDPLWFLARQWQTGEFDAENGGRVAHMELSYTNFAIDGFSAGGDGEVRPLSPQTPLNYAIEAEDEGGSSPSWRSEALEYTCSVQAGAVSATCQEYYGTNLDWYHFDLASGIADDNTDGDTITVRVVPTGLAYQNMPHPRWWRFEEKDAFVYLTSDSEPNVLSMLLPEFLNADSNNWFIAPVEQPVGHFRRMDRVRVMDSFGVVTEIAPVSSLQNDQWEVFTLDAANTGSGAASAPATADIFFAPNVGATVLNGEVFEEINFIRDEDANCVWGVERYYFDPDKNARVNRDDEEAAVPSDDDAGSSTNGEEDASVPNYRMRSRLRGNWIPFIPKRIDESGAENFEQTYLRRARSSESADAGNPHYKTKVVEESWKLLEEEVPRVGLNVQRLWRFVRGSDGTAWFWNGRRKRLGVRERSANINYDYLE